MFQRRVSKIPWLVVTALCLTLGLAPYQPPHLIEKLGMLMEGRLVRLIDWFDLLLHASPWALLIAKATVSLLRWRGRPRP